MSINIKNKKAFFEYQLLEKYVAGIGLMGSEIKSIRAGKASIREAHCYFKKDELWIKNMHIDEYREAASYGHEPLRERKLLLNRKELDKIRSKVNEKGLTLIALRLFLSNRGFAKLEIGLGKGKKLHDKRETIKKRETDRQIKMEIKIR